MLTRSAAALPWLLLFPLWLGGCADPAPAPVPSAGASSSSATPAADTLPPQAPPSQAAASQAYQDQQQAGQAQQPSASAAADGDMERVRAGVGVGQKGRRLDQFDSGVQQAIAQPAKSLFAAKEKMIFQIAIPQAMQLFEATNGRAPKSHDEFMKQIIGFNNIDLPALPEGQRYVYDPQTKELMVERPAQQ